MTNRKETGDQAAVDTPVLRAGCLRLADDSAGAQVHLASTHAKVPLCSGSVKISLSRRSPTPAPSSRSSTPSGFCWFHRKHGVNAINCREPCSFSRNESAAPSQDEFCSPTLLYVQDVLSGREFLVDSGASVSVFPGPKSSSDRGLRLLTASGSSMFCSGSRLIPLRLSC